MTELIFNQSFFAEHFDKFEEIFSLEDAHPECFYIPFFGDFIEGSSSLTDEVKNDWMDSWKEDFDGDDDYDLSLSFDEFIEEHEWLLEDVAANMISDSYPEIKAKAMPQLFFHISEMWSEEGIQDAINQIKEVN